MRDAEQQYITDEHGKKMSVILPIRMYKKMLEDIEKLEDLEDIELYDKAKKEDDGKRILFSDYVKNRESKNA